VNKYNSWFCDANMACHVARCHNVWLLNFVPSIFLEFYLWEGRCLSIGRCKHTSWTFVLSWLDLFQFFRKCWITRLKILQNMYVYFFHVFFFSIHHVLFIFWHQNQVIILYNTSLRGWNDMKNNNDSFIAMPRKTLNWVKGLKCSNCKKMEKKNLNYYH
jgi:hypothetical protein